MPVPTTVTAGGGTVAVASNCMTDGTDMDSSSRSSSNSPAVDLTNANKAKSGSGGGGGCDTGCIAGISIGAAAVVIMATFMYRKGAKKTTAFQQSQQQGVVKHSSIAAEMEQPN